MIVDTNIIIDYLKGKQEAVDFITGLQKLTTSVIVTAELYSGVKGSSEKKEIKQFLKHVEQIEVNEEIATQAGLLRKNFMKSHGVEIPDAIIAATADYLQVPIATLDKKHFSVLTDELVIPY